jgi:hypothetical protein
VQQISLEATQSLKIHLIEAILINKLAPSFTDYVLSQEPQSLHVATNAARAMRKRKFPNGQNMPKLQKI